MKNNNYIILKSILDIFISIVLLVLLSPVFIAISIKIKINNDGPILFKQERLGKNGKTIIIYKFRTMHINNDLFNFKEKDQVTKFGKFLRKFGLDELPQLFNILKGEMSLIGPRATVSKYYEYYTPNQKRRLEVAPGLFGPTNCVTKDTSILDKIKLDIDYVENYSVKEDLKLIYTFLTNFNDIMSHRNKGATGNKKAIEIELETLKENLIIYKKTITSSKNNQINDLKNINTTHFTKIMKNNTPNQEVTLSNSKQKKLVLRKTLSKERK